MSRGDEAQNEDPDEVTTLWGDASAAIHVPDSGQLFGGDFFRVGPDLYIVNDGDASFRVPAYFDQAELGDLYDPNGAVLRGSLVRRLAGPEAPGQQAQLDAAVRSDPVGQVETITGAASVQRSDGTVAALDAGTQIYQADVVSTEAGSSVSLSFTEGTIFALSASARMVIDDLTYDPQSAENAAQFSLVQGEFVFIAGDVARSGGMQVVTPSSTLDITGTTVVVEVATIDGVDRTQISLTMDPDGGQGEVDLRGVDGDLITTITQTDSKWTISAATGEILEEPRSPADVADDSQLIAQAMAAHRSVVARAESGETSGGQAASSSTPTIRELAEEGDQVAETIATPPAVSEGAGEVRFSGLVGATEDITVLLPGEDPIVSISGVEDGDATGAISGDLRSAARASTAVFDLSEGPANGTATVMPNGLFEYVPTPDFNGTDSFTFTVTAANGATRQGTVVIEVAAVNDPPVASDDTAQGTADTAVTGNVIATDVDGDVLNFALQTPPANGVVVIDQQGQYTFFPAPGFVGADSFGVLVSDPDGETAVATISLTITPEVEGATSTVVVMEWSGPQSEAGQDVQGDAAEAGPIQGGFESPRAEWIHELEPEYTQTDRMIVTPPPAGTGSGRSKGMAMGRSNREQVSSVEPPVPMSRRSLGDAQDPVPHTATESQGVNLMIALDAAGGAEGPDWARQRDAVAEAIEDLAARFDGSGVPIDVMITAYSDTAYSLGPFDVHAPELLDVVRTLPYLGGHRGWDLALKEAQGFYGSQSSETSNVLVLMTDGAPMDDMWQVVIDQLRGPRAANGQDVEIRAFALREIGELDSLQTLDPTATVLRSPLDLVTALGQVRALAALEHSPQNEPPGGRPAPQPTASEETDGSASSNLDADLSPASLENLGLLLGMPQQTPGDTAPSLGRADDPATVGMRQGMPKIRLDENLHEDLVPAFDFRRAEAFGPEQGTVLEMSLADVVDLSEADDGSLASVLDHALPDPAVIYGDTTDRLRLLAGEQGQFQKVSDNPVEDGKGKTLDIYAYVEGGNVLATLGVDTDIDVIGVATVS